MRIAQFYHEDRIRLGVVKDNNITPIEFKGNMIEFMKSGQSVDTGKNQAIPLDRVRLSAPVTSPSKIIAIGLNYKDHARESKGKIPDVPLVFAKFPNSLTGHGHTITWIRNVTKKVDFEEAELAVIIGKTVLACPESRALDAVFGYTCANDVSARDLQFGDGQWVRGKSLDTFCPLGPWIVTPDEIPDPHALKIRCRLNNRLMQDSHTGHMISIPVK